MLNHKYTLRYLPLFHDDLESVPSKKQRDYPYYRIYVGNYIIYYVVIPEGKERIMEVRKKR